MVLKQKIHFDKIVKNGAKNPLKANITKIAIEVIPKKKLQTLKNFALQ